MMNKEYRVESGIFGYKSLGFFRPVFSLQPGGIEVKGVLIPYEAINRVVIKECFVPQTHHPKYGSGCSYYKSQMIIHTADRKLKIKGSALLQKEDPWFNKFIDGTKNDGRSPAYQYAKSQFSQHLGSRYSIEESEYTSKVFVVVLGILFILVLAAIIFT